MSETHTSKSTVPGGESSEKPTMIDHPTPDGESPSTEDLGAESEEEASRERLGRIGDELGRLATGRRFYDPKPSDSQPPGPPVDESKRLRAVLRAAGKLNPTKAEPKPSTREDVLAALRGATTGANKPVPRSQAREEVLAALRGEHSSPAAEKANSDSDSSVKMASLAKGLVRSPRQAGQASPEVSLP